MTAVVSTRDYTASPGSCISAHDEVVYLILSVTPWGTPMLTVADRTLCRLIFLSAPYSTTVPNQPVLEEEPDGRGGGGGGGGGEGESQGGKQTVLDRHHCERQTVSQIEERYVYTRGAQNSRLSSYHGLGVMVFGSVCFWQKRRGQREDIHVYIHNECTQMDGT